MALDYALRSAIAQHDQVMLSALRNHGPSSRRDAMLLLDTDGRVEIDTLDRIRRRRGFRTTTGDARIRTSFRGGRGMAWTRVLDGRRAGIRTNLVGLIAAAIPIDDPLLRACRPVGVAQDHRACNARERWPLERRRSRQRKRRADRTIDRAWRHATGQTDSDRRTRSRIRRASCLAEPFLAERTGRGRAWLFGR